MKRHLLLVILSLACVSAVHAADIIFYNISWPRHDKATGILEWELSASTARPVSDNEYACSDPELYAFKLAGEGGRQVSEKDLYLQADQASYIHGTATARAKLAGHVVATLYGAETVTMTARDAELEFTWNAREKLKTRRIDTNSKVTVTSETRKLTGEGMVVFEQVSGDGQQKSTITLNKNIVMEAQIEPGAGALPDVTASQEQAAEAAGPTPVTIACLGPFVFDRSGNVAHFHNHVILTHGGTTLNCQKLTLLFEKATGQGENELVIAGMLAEDNVTVSGTDQRFEGDRFEWNTTVGAGTLVGKPATMYAPGSVGTAERIEFDQETQVIKYIGVAEPAQFQIDLPTQ